MVSTSSSSSSIPSIIAHRGNSGVYAENTRAAFLSALDFQAYDDYAADGVEADIHLTKDGVPVVIHDSELIRTTGTPGTVSKWTHDELKKLNYSEWKNEPIPASYGQVNEQLITVSELVELVVNARAQSHKRTVKLLIELKHPSPYGRELENNIINALKEHNYDPATSTIVKSGISVEVFFISFDCHALTHLIELHHICSGHVSILFDKPAVPASGSSSSKYDGLSRGCSNEEEKEHTYALMQNFLTTHSQAVIGAGKDYLLSHVNEVKEWLESERMISTWTVNTIREARQLHQLGIQKITTNYPLAFKQEFSFSTPH